MAGVVGVPEGKGTGLSPRTVDDTASGPPRPRAWTDGGTCVPRQPPTGHGVQDPRPGGGEAAQSAVLSGMPRSRLCGKDGRGAVRLSPSENLEEGGGRFEEEAERGGGDHLLRRETRHPGHRNDRAEPAARARR